MSELLRTDDKGVLRLTLSNPGTGNALSPDMVEAFIDALEMSNRTPPSEIIVVGKGRHFCTGFDLSDLDDLSDGDLLHRLVRIETLLQRLHHAPCPTVAFAHGVAFGAGADLFVACQYRVASSAAKFAFPGPNFGLVLGTGRLAAILGAQRALSLIERNAPVMADDARHVGLVTEITTDTDTKVKNCGVNHTPLGHTFGTATMRALRSSALPDTRDKDMAALVRSAAEPGLKDRIVAYRDALQRARG